VNTLRQIKNIVYRLKRSHGVKATLRKRGADSYDVQTGAITRASSDIVIKRAIILPSQMTRQFFYDLSYVAANKNFAEGGFADINSSVAIIDIRDLPKGTAIDNNDSFLANGNQYEIDKTDSDVIPHSYMLKLKRVEGQ